MLTEFTSLPRLMKSPREIRLRVITPKKKKKKKNLLKSEVCNTEMSFSQCHC